MATKHATTKASAKTTGASGVTLDFAFFRFLWRFYQDNRGAIRQSYKELTRKFLDFNNPEKNPKAFLRQPQFEALETYVFLKEFLGTAMNTTNLPATALVQGSIWNISSPI